MAIVLEDPEGVALVEVLPLDQSVGEHLAHALDERFDEVVVLLAGDAAGAVPDVERVFQQRGVVGADVEADGQHLGWMDAGTGHVERQLADGDAHPPGALVAETEDALVVGDHDQADVLVGEVAQARRDAVDVVRSEPDPAHVAHDVAEALAGFTDRRGVDDGHQLGEVLHQHPVEQHLVAVQQACQADVALEVVGLLANVLELELDLLLDGVHRGGQEAMQPALRAFFGSEGQAFVGRRVLQQPDAALVRLDPIWATEARVACFARHGNSLTLRPRYARRSDRASCW